MRKVCSCKQKPTTLLRGSRFGRTWLRSAHRKVISGPSYSFYTTRPREDRKYVAASRRTPPPADDHRVRDRSSPLLNSRYCKNADRHIPESKPACDLCGPTVRRHVTGADGRVSRLLLRISLPIHHGD